MIIITIIIMEWMAYMKCCDKECEQKQIEISVDEKTLHFIHVLISKTFNTTEHHYT